MRMPTRGRRGASLAWITDAPNKQKVITERTTASLLIMLVLLSKIKTRRDSLEHYLFSVVFATKKLYSLASLPFTIHSGSNISLGSKPSHWESMKRRWIGNSAIHLSWRAVGAVKSKKKEGG